MFGQGAITSSLKIKRRRDTLYSINPRNDEKQKDFSGKIEPCKSRFGHSADSHLAANLAKNNSRLVRMRLLAQIKASRY